MQIPVIWGVKFTHVHALIFIMFLRNVLIFSIVLCSMAVSAVGVKAYDRQDVRSVKDRMRTDYTATGGRFGSFILRPSVTLEQHYDDNIYRDPQNERSDHITVAQPEIEVQTDIPLLDVRAGVRGRLARHKKNSNENYDDYSVFLSGRYEIDYSTYVDASLSHARQHVGRYDVEDIQGSTLIKYDVQKASLGFTRALGVVKLFLNSEYSNFKYDDSTRSTVRIDNSERDHNRLDLSARLAYGTSNLYDVYLEGLYNTRSYDKLSTAYSSSDGYRMRVGSMVNITGKVRANAYVGYLSQSYDHTFKDTHGLDFGGDLLWNVSGLTSVLLEASREVRETQNSNASGILRTSAELGLQHALRDNMLIDGYISYLDDHYQGGALASVEDSYALGTGLGFLYNMNPNINAGVNYDFSKRDYERRDEDYTNHTMMMFMNYEY